MHVHNLGPLIYGSLAKCFSLGRVRLVLTLHSLTDLQQGRRYRVYFKFFSRFSDRIIAVSNGVRMGLVALGIRPERIEVIPNGVSFSDVSRLGGNPPAKLSFRQYLIPGLTAEVYQARWMLCLARLHPGKGQDVVLNVWSALSKETRSGLTLFFVGQETQAGHQEWLRQKIHEVPDRERIVIVGPSEHPHEWIESADLFISGSFQEGMPLAPLESAGSGLPTLLSDIEGHHFLKRWAYYFNPSKPEEGACKIAEILKTLEGHDVSNFFEDRWAAAAPLRERWSAPAMTASYADAFESA